jgi:hypothetical protein
MTTDSAQSQWSVQSLLELFDVKPDGQDRFIAETGLVGEDERQVVEGTQVLAQVIVAVAKRFPDKSARVVRSSDRPCPRGSGSASESLGSAPGDKLWM